MTPRTTKPLLPSAALVLALAAILGTIGALGTLGVEPAHAGKRCTGAGKSPKYLSVPQAQRLVACLVNKRRSSHGRSRLKIKKSVRRAAVSHTRRMQRRSCFSHQCPGEPDLTGRLVKTDYLPCRCNWGARENIAWGKGKRSGSPAKIVKAWMRSSIHRSAILAGGLEHVGVGFRRGSPFSGNRKLGSYTLNLGYRR